MRHGRWWWALWWWREGQEGQWTSWWRSSQGNFYFEWAGGHVPAGCVAGGGGGGADTLPAAAAGDGGCGVVSPGDTRQLVAAAARPDTLPLIPVLRR